MTRKFAILAVVIVLALSVAGCTGGAEPTTPSTETPSTETPSTETPPTEAPPASESSAGEQLVQTKCSMCHDLSRVEAATYDQAQWEATVGRMQQNGLVVTDEEKQQIIAYLVERDAAK